MGTGVPHKRIVTGNFGLYTLKTEHKIYYSHSLFFCQYLFLLFFLFFFLGQALGLLVLVSSIHYCTYTSNLSTLLSLRDLTHLRFGISYLEGGFTLRCLQRLSVPYLATQLCIGRKPEVVKKRFKSRYEDKELEREVELFTWEKLDAVDRIKAEFGIN